MPISEEEAFGPTRSAKRKKADETGFIESALAGVATGLPPLVAAGETISGAGTILNVAVDLSDGKSMTDIAIDKAPSLILGRIGGAANRSITKNANPSDLIDGTTNTAKTIIQSNIMVYDKLIIPAVQTKLKEKKN